jgi:hypothetical protein
MSRQPDGYFGQRRGTCSEETHMSATLRAALLLAVGLSLSAIGAVPALAALYVVDQNAPGAADTNPGTEEQPWKTVQHAAGVAQPGDTVFVCAGKYDERVTVKTSGASGKPITFQAMPRRSAVVGGFDLAASHIRIVGFEITWPEPQTAVNLRGHYCELLDNYIHDMYYAVDGTDGTLNAETKKRDYSAVTHHRIAYNKVYHSEFGFILGGNDWLVENNEISRLFMYADPTKRNVDCDYTRFFGKNCIQRYNYYHGTDSQESKVAHVDGIQTFINNGGIAENCLFEDNMVCDWGQGCMVSSSPRIDNIKNFTFRRNIFSSNTPAYHGAWGVNLIDVPNVTIENNTFSAIVWNAVGLRGPNCTGGRIAGNICHDVSTAVVDRDRGHPQSAGPLVEYNLAFKTKEPLAGDKNINGKDPLFVDAEKRNFRLQKDSPAIGAGADKATIGALAYPNVYYVDPRHPAASDDPPWGYAAVPLKTVAKALEVASPGETIILRGGVYRETIAPKKDGLTIRAMKGEKVIVSGADLIEGWQRQASDGSWKAFHRSRPKQVLRDGKPWNDFFADIMASTIWAVVVKAGGDPRLHVFETVVRENGLVLSGAKNLKVEDIEVVNTFGPGTVGGK